MIRSILRKFFEMSTDGGKDRDWVFAGGANIDRVSEALAEQFRCQDGIDLLLSAAVACKYQLGLYSSSWSLEPICWPILS